MTPAHHEPDRDLGRSLARQADRLAAHGSPLELDQVLNRAGEIRRGRRMRASMVMAAVVLAVAVPVGISALDDPTKPDQVQPAATPTPSDKRPLGLGEYKDGNAPKNGYTLADKLVRDGNEQSIGDSDVSYLARINGGFLLGQSDPSNGATTVRVLSDAGDGTDQTWAFDGEGIAVSPDGSVGAFVDNDGTVIAVQDGGTQVHEVGTLPKGSYETVAVDGSDCSQEANDCSVWVVDQGETATTWRISPLTGAFSSAFPDGLIDRDAAGNSVRQKSYDFKTGTACYAYLNADQVEVWQSCDFEPTVFSPDGKYLLAEPSGVDGPGPNRLVILNAEDGTTVLDLKAVVSENSPMLAVVDSTWEDASHVLATVQEGNGAAVIRFSLDGNREYAVPKVPLEDAFGSAPIRVGRG